MMHRSRMSHRLRATFLAPVFPAACVLALGGCAQPAKCPVAEDRVAESMPVAEPAPAPVQPTIEPKAAPVQVDLKSWKDTQTKRKIVAFVKDVTDPKSPNFVPENERISVFDNDGTLWVESPIYTQLAFTLDRIRALSPQHPEWKSKQPFQGVIENDAAKIAKLDMKQLVELVMAAHAGTSSEEFLALVSDWFAKATHPKFGRPYTELVYLPMIELLDYLTRNGFKTYIVSGGGVDFIRAFAGKVYGIPPEQVIGSALQGEYDPKANLVRRKAELLFGNDGPVKAVSIARIIGQRPILAFGNSDGDYEMLAWTTGGKGARLGAFVHHTDEGREAAYDRDSPVGKLSRGLDDAAAKNWLIVDMKTDWSEMFPTK